MFNKYELPWYTIDGNYTLSTGFSPFTSTTYVWLYIFRLIHGNYWAIIIRKCFSVAANSLLFTPTTLSVCSWIEPLMVIVAMYAQGKFGKCYLIWHPYMPVCIFEPDILLIFLGAAFWKIILKHWKSTQDVNSWPKKVFSGGDISQRWYLQSQFFVLSHWKTLKNKKKNS